MKNVLFRKLKMYLNVLSVLKAYIDVWVSSVPFKTEVNQFEANLIAIDKKTQALTGSEGVSENKKQMSRELMDAVLVVCGAGTAYASQINNMELKTRFNFSKSDLLHGNEKDFYHRCVNICKAAEGISDALQAYNLPTDHLQYLMTTAIAFDQLIAAPREVIKAEKSSKEEIEAFYEKCDIQLDERLDNLMLIYKNSQQDFYTEYANARQIGGWHKKKDADQAAVN